MSKYVTRKYTFTIEPEGDNTINASGNYRIFTIDEPMTNILAISYIKDDVTIPEGSPSIGDGLKKYVRYSLDGDVWSMWYEFTNVDFSSITNIISTLSFDPDDDFYISFKYEYYNGEDMDELMVPIVINSIETQLTIRQVKVPLALNAKVNASCTPEFCAETLFDRNSKLDLYDIGNLSSVYLAMSTATQTLAGLSALYFQSSPDPTGTDFQFREYTLYNIIQRKCVKAVVPGNQFPDMSFVYNPTDMGYLGPLEAHFDKAYFESMFGVGKEPRTNDIIYFPLINRLYQIEDVEMVRGLMMIPVYWKCNLVKYKPNINMMKPENEAMFLDDITLDSEEQFGEEAQAQADNATMKQQYSTESPKSSEVRSYKDKSVQTREESLNFAYNAMIRYCYNMGGTSYEDENCIIYKKEADISNGNDSTFSFFFKIPSNNQNKKIVIVSTTSHNSNFEIGLNLGFYQSEKYTKSSIYIKINGLEQKLDLNMMLTQNEWYAAIIGVSPTYKQLEMYAYSLIEDEFDNNNITGFAKLNSMLLPIPQEDISFSEENKFFSLRAGSYHISNFRIFKRPMPIEKHEFILSELFLKDESMLSVIDNCRPQLGMPYLMKKY